MVVFKKIFYTFISLFFIYVLSGFFIIPAILKEQITKNLDENLNAKSSIEKIKFNPLTFDLKLHNFKLLSLQDEELIKVKKLEIRLGILKSLDQKHFRIEYILLDELLVNLVQTKDGKINLNELVKQNSSTQEESQITDNKSSKEFAFLIAKLDLKNTNFNFKSLINNEPYNLNLKDINYTIYDLGTYKNFLSSNNLIFKINKNTDVIVKGAFNIDPFKAYGKVEIKDLRAKEFLQFDKKLFNFDINEELNINLTLNYNIDASKEFLLNLNTDLFEINNFDLIQKNNKILNFKKLDIKKFDLNLKEQNIDLSDIFIDGLNVNMIMDKDGINFANLINSQNNEDKKEENKEDNLWKINFKNLNLNANYNFNNILQNSKVGIKSILFNLNDLKIADSNIYLSTVNLKTSNINYLDKQNNLDIKSNNTNINLNNLNLTNDNLKIENIELFKDNLGFKELNSNIDINAKKFETSFKNIEISKNISYSLNDLKLKNLSFIDNKNRLKASLPEINISLNNFLLNEKNEINLKNITLKNPALHFEDLTNKLSINTKNIEINTKNLLLTKEANISFDTLKLLNPSINILDDKNNLKIDTKKLSIDLNKFKLNNKNISLDFIKIAEPNLEILDTQSNLKIDAKNINLNLKKLLTNDNSLKIGKTDLIDSYISILLPKKPNVEVKETDKNETKVTSNQNSVNKEIKEENKSALNLGPVDIKNLTLNFEDKNLPIPFKTTISKLNGQISELKSKDKNISKLEIKGIVDEYGVAKITGVVNPNSIKILTDINMKFQNIAIKNFTPYTAKFVGRTIKDGKLELDLNYNISDSNLNAKNSIVIKKLELGEKVQSPDSVSLPLDLAITLLEDSSNTIDINLPISGNVDDPQFSVASIVWKAFVNLITKAITAPFSLIGSLFNFSEDEIKSVNFNLKESEITPIQKETLDKIALILSKKEDIAIKFAPSFNEKEEKEKFAKQRLENIKEYLLLEKKINPKQIITVNDLKKSSSNIDLNIEQIK